MAAPSINKILNYADLQMAAEAFLTTNTPPFPVRSDLVVALTEGNKRSSKFTKTQATDFLANWAVVAQQPNTETGFSGTLFRRIRNDPVTGAQAGELVKLRRRTSLARWRPTKNSVRRSGATRACLPSLQPIDWVDVCQGAHCGEGLSCAVAMQRFEVRDVLGRLCRPRLRARPARRGFA